MNQVFMRSGLVRQIASPAFWLLWLATSCANLADGIFKLALPLLAIQFSDSPAQVAGVAFAIRLPWLVFALFAGLLVDRVDRRQAMIVANFARVFVLSSLVASMMFNWLSLPLLYLIALVLGIAETIADTSSAAILPSLVENKELERANAWLVGAITVNNEFIGPPLGGALALFSLAFAFSSSSLLYLAAAFALILIVGSFKSQSQKSVNLWVDLRSGLSYVWGDKVLRTLLIIVAVMNLGWSAWFSVMVLYLVHPANLSEFGYGLLLTSIGIGGLVGAVITLPIVRVVGRRWAIAADIFGTFMMLFVPALTDNAWLIACAGVIGGVGSSMWGIVVSSIRQERVPDALQGRTAGVFRLFGYGALPLGAALAGFVAEWMNIPSVFAICAFLTALLFLPFLQLGNLKKD